jgi:adenine-specific DNA-methyltransferase
MDTTDQDAIFSQFSSRAIDVFDAILALDKASALDGKARKDGGVVYTPKAIAMEMCLLAKPQLHESVFEPSCGRGVFVFALAETHLASAGAQEVHDALARRLWACDLDAQAVEDMKKLWTIYWMGKGVAAPQAPRVASEDSLFGAFSSLAFDLTLGNPPYVRFQHLAVDYRRKLQTRYATCAQGNVDLYFAFVEQALRQSLRSCLIFPNSWMSSASAKALRGLLTSHATHVADYGSALPFAPARAYVCVVLATKQPRAHASPLRAQTQGLSMAKDWDELDAHDSRVAPSGWSLSAAAAAPDAQGPVKTLGDIAELRSGIATLADSAYKISNAKVDENQAQFLDDKTGLQRKIPAQWAPKKIKLTKVKSQADLVAWQERIFYPYDNKAALIAFNTIKEQSPDAASFLEARKEALALRDKGKQDDYPEWHAYGRKQGLKPLPAGRACAVRAMSEGKMECFEFDMDEVGPFLFTSGFVLIPKPGHCAADILNVLQSPQAWEWILAHGKPWAGADGKNYRSYGARLLLRLPLSP